MAYGDYGGYAWLDGKLIPANSDRSIYNNTYHVVLGAGQTLVGMRKQSATDVYKDGGLVAVPELNDFYGLVESEEIVTVKLGDSTLSVAYRYTDNYYQFAWFQTESGIWQGFSGYGVGAGLEDCSYGYSTEECIQELEMLFGGDLQRNHKFSY
jgi:hypothetical protein